LRHFFAEDGSGLLGEAQGRVLPGRPAGEVLGREIPVEALLDHGLEIGRPLVLVVEVVGVLPHVDRQQRIEILVRQRVAVMGLLDRQLAALLGEPDPAAREMAGAAIGELVLERLERAERLVDPGREVARRLSRFRGQRMPVEPVVPALRRVVEQALVGAARAITVSRSAPSRSVPAIAALVLSR
jgi:hypothetical protein